MRGWLGMPRCSVLFATMAYNALSFSQIDLTRVVRVAPRTYPQAYWPYAGGNARRSNTVAYETTIR
jgi:hypothetical protein